MFGLTNGSNTFGFYSSFNFFSTGSQACLTNSERKNYCSELCRSIKSGNLVSIRQRFKSFPIFVTRNTFQPSKNHQNDFIYMSPTCWGKGSRAYSLFSLLTFILSLDESKSLQSHVTLRNMSVPCDTRNGKWGLLQPSQSPDTTLFRI